MKEEDTKEYWDKKWAYGEHRRERVTLEGSDGEEEFDQELRLNTVRKTVLDLGCGSGSFSLKIARKAKRLTGIDISTTALKQAERNLARSGLINVDFRFADSRRLPFPNSSFDLVYSRRGPGSESFRILSEIYRVLRRKGTFMEITIGERDKKNIVRIFGRGQMLGVKGEVCTNKRRMLESVGFKRVVARDYVGTEIFKGMSDLMVRLQSAPIIPNFDPRKDSRHLARVRKELMTDRGIETPVHRVVLIGQRSTSLRLL